MNLLKNAMALLAACSLLSACREQPGKPADPTLENAPQDVPAQAGDNAPAAFQKTLALQGFTFEVSATGEGSLQQLTIKPEGLEISNDPIGMEIDGTVENAEIEDLNSDGFPELLVYTVSAGSGSYGRVIGYSVYGGKSLGPIYFPELPQTSEAAAGYMGHDEFRIVETSLVRRFPVYKEGDSNSNPTGGTRQIQYKMAAGENAPVFVIDTVTDY